MTDLEWLARNGKPEHWLNYANFITKNHANFITKNQWQAERQRLGLDAAEQPAQSTKPNKYQRQIKGVTLDVYDILQAWQVTNPALQHLIKKALQPGYRGHKDLMTDLNDILASAKRAIELEQETTK